MNSKIELKKRMEAWIPEIQEKANQLLAPLRKKVVFEYTHETAGAVQFLLHSEYLNPLAWEEKAYKEDVIDRMANGIVWAWKSLYEKHQSDRFLVDSEIPDTYVGTISWREAAKTKPVLDPSGKMLYDEEAEVIEEEAFSFEDPTGCFVVHMRAIPYTLSEPCVLGSQG